jgi:RNA polymerase sigma-70 factor (ECF subfamily)
VAEPAEPAQRALLDQFMAAFEHADVAGLARLLRDDVVLEMPPLLTWFAGRDDVTRFFATQVFPHNQFRMAATTANGQPAAAGYHLDRSGGYHAHALTVLTVTTAGLARIDTFLDPGLFPKFGLPGQLPAG